MFLGGFDIGRCLPGEPQAAAGRWMTRQVSKLGDKGTGLHPSVSAETEPQAAVLAREPGARGMCAPAAPSAGRPRAARWRLRPGPRPLAQDTGPSRRATWRGGNTRVQTQPETEDPLRMQR